MHTILNKSTAVLVLAIACSAQQLKQPFCISGTVYIPDYPREALIRHMDGHLEINRYTGEPIGKSAGPMNDLMREAGQKMVHELKIQGEGNVLIDYKVDESAACGGLVRASFFDPDRIEIVYAPVCRDPKMPTPRLLSMEAPIYPPLARVARIMGTVTIAAKISPEGRVTEAEVERGHPILRQAAKDNVLTWKFEPSVETKSIEATVQFVLPAEGNSCGFTFTIPNHLRVVASPPLVETMEMY